MVQKITSDFLKILLLIVGSFVVLDTESLEEIMGYTHRKEEISDIKFSPGKIMWALCQVSRFRFQLHVGTNKTYGLVG